MIPCLHHENICIKREQGVCRDQKCIPLVGGKTPLTCAVHQATPSKGRQYRAENGNLRKLGRTSCHITVFAPRQYLYEKGAMGIERPEMHSPNRCETPSYLCGSPNYPVSK